MGIPESFGCQFVDIGRLRVGIAVATDPFGTVILAREPKNIGAADRLRGCTLNGAGHSTYGCSSFYQVTDFHSTPSCCIRALHNFVLNSDAANTTTP